jgi:disulfide bond formation protein DsbB
VEQLWWEGLASSTAGSIEGISTADLLDPTKDVAAVVRCDEIAWQLLGISMAGWNVILSVIFAGLWVKAARTA